MPNSDALQLGQTTPHHLLKRPWILAITTATVLAIYSYPALRTAVATQSMRLPAVSEPDLGLYLSISEIERQGDGTFVNPYYHIGVPANAGGYLKFRSGPVLFGFLNAMLGGRLWWTLFAWNLLWWGLLFITIIWFFERFLPKPPVGLPLVASTLLMLVSIEGLGRFIGALLNSSSMPFVGGLPYLRPFAPQVMMTLFVCYVGLQVWAMSDKTLTPWCLMALLQFVALTNFPFCTLMMAGISTVAVGWYLLHNRCKAAWIKVAGFALGCFLLDGAFVQHGFSRLGLGFTGSGALIKIQPSLVGKSIGKLWVLTALLVCLTALTRRLRPEIKWTLVGMGVSNILFVLGDAVVSESVFYVSQHIGYFYQPTIIILSIFLVSVYVPQAPSSDALVRVVLLTALGVSFVYALAMADGNYRLNYLYNSEQRDLAEWFAKNKVEASDLVVTQFSGLQYDACEWIPLLSKAEVLYCRNAQLTLTAEQNRDIQRYREVLYLYFEGKDSQWLQTHSDFERYGLYGELESYRKPEERAARVIEVRAEMLPFFDRVENSDPSVKAFFRTFRRVWIVQKREDKILSERRLVSYFDPVETDEQGILTITMAVPK